MKSHQKIIRLKKKNLKKENDNGRVNISKFSGSCNDFPEIVNFGQKRELKKMRSHLSIVENRKSLNNTQEKQKKSLSRKSSIKIG